MIRVDASQVLTNVGLEHTRWLGPTVRDIAREKLAVVRDGATLVVGADLHPDALEEARAGRRARTAPGSSRRRPTPASRSPRPATFQRRNFALARAAAAALPRARARSSTSPPCAPPPAPSMVPGRFEVVGARAADASLDGAHNPAGSPRSPSRCRS